jgi:hypothetical protein
MTISDDLRDFGKFAHGVTPSRKRRTRTVSRSGNGVGSGASMQERRTLKAIRLTQLQACPPKKYKIILNLFEQTKYKVWN